MFLFNVQRNIVLFVALQFCIHGLSCSEFNNPDPDDDVEVFSSKEISSIINLNEEVQLMILKIEKCLKIKFIHTYKNCFIFARHSNQRLNQFTSKQKFDFDFRGQELHHKL